MKPKLKRGKARGVAAAPTSAVTLAAPPSEWDHGATGPANRAGMQAEPRGDINPATGERSNPNGVTGMRRVERLETWHNCFLAGRPNRAWITTEQYNAAIAYRDTFEATQRAPGTDYAKPKVDSSPKPDHAVTIQIDRISAFQRAARNISAADRPIIWHCVIEGSLPATLRINGVLAYRDGGFDVGYIALRAALDRLARATPLTGK